MNSIHKPSSIYEDIVLGKGEWYTEDVNQPVDKKEVSPVMNVTTWNMDALEAFMTRTNFRLAQMERRLELTEARTERAERLLRSTIASIDELRVEMRRDLKNFKARIYRTIRKFRASALQN